MTKNTILRDAALEDFAKQAERGGVFSDNPYSHFCRQAGALQMHAQRLSDEQLRQMLPDVAEKSGIAGARAVLQEAADRAFAFAQVLQPNTTGV